MRAARSTFQDYARLEPRLLDLWKLCQQHAVPANDETDLEHDRELDDIDHQPERCVDDFFFREIKPQLLQLVGWGRQEGPAELRRSEAYESVYAALYEHALPRTCECCRVAPG